MEPTRTITRKIVQLSERDRPDGIFSVANSVVRRTCTYIYADVRDCSTQWQHTWMTRQRESPKKSGEKGKEVPRSTGSG